MNLGIILILALGTALAPLKLCRNSVIVFRLALPIGLAVSTYCRNSGIMFRLANGGLEIQYRKNGVGFRTLNTVNLKTSANNPDYTSIFPLRFDTASYSGSGAAMDNIQLIVD